MAGRATDRAMGTNMSGAFPAQSDGTAANPRGTAAERAWLRSVEVSALLGAAGLAPAAQGFSATGLPPAALAAASAAIAAAGGVACARPNAQ